MKILGIIAEYNPFHNGHKYQLEKSKEVSGCDFVVAVMSGNFLQRGEPALCDKWLRAEIAVKNGIDLVLELPTAFACNNAEYFAMGAVKLLNGLGCVSHLAFGSESGKIEELDNVASFISNMSVEIISDIKSEMKLGLSYPVARNNVFLKNLGEGASSIAKSPNNNLAIEYLKQLKETNSKIKPITIKRQGSEYNDLEINGNIASATAIREALRKSDFDLNSVVAAIPEATFDTLKEWGIDYKPTLYDDFFEMIRYKALSTNSIEISQIFSISEGLENRIKESAMTAKNISQLIAMIKSKRFTQTRIQRTLIHLLLDLTSNKMNRFMDSSSIYGRVLGISQNGGVLLNKIKTEECSTIPILTNINKEAHKYPNIKELLDFDINASNIYNLGSKTDIYEHSDYVKRLFLENLQK